MYRIGEPMVFVRRLRDGAALPARSHHGDAGADLCACIEGERDFVDVRAGETRRVPVGIAVVISHGYCGVITSRSSARMRGLAISGLIDAGYRGEISMIVTNVSRETIRIESGERIGQLVVHGVELPRFVEVDLLDDTDRGAGGFGSTGR